MNIQKYIKKIKLKKLLEKLGMKIESDLGNNYMCCCPFHAESNASWGINKNTGAHNCFSCGAKGSLISLVAKKKDISFKEAIKYLYDFAGIKSDKIVINAKTVNRQIKNILKEKIETPKEKADKYIMNAELPQYISRDFFYGIEYFKNRGINKETINKNDISFCRKGFYKNRAIIPIKNLSGKMVSFEARDLTRLAEKKVLYPKHTKIKLELYGLKRAKKRKEVIIVEGVMDALYLQQRGFNTISTFGVGIGVEQEELICRYFRKAYIAYDSDRAGKIATITVGKKLSLYLQVFVICLPKGKDPDEISGDEFKVLLHNATIFDKYVYKGVLKA